MLSLSSIVYIFRFVQLRKYSQIADVALRVVFLLFLSYFFLLFRLVPAVVLTLETCEMSAIFFTTKTTQPRPRFSR